MYIRRSPARYCDNEDILIYQEEEGGLKELLYTDCPDAEVERFINTGKIKVKNKKIKINSLKIYEHTESFHRNDNYKPYDA